MKKASPATPLLLGVVRAAGLGLAAPRLEHSDAILPWVVLAEVMAKAWTMTSSGLLPLGTSGLGGCFPSIDGGRPSLVACSILCLSSLAYDGCLVPLLLVSLPQPLSRSLIKSSHLLPGLRDHGPLSWTSSFLH